MILGQMIQAWREKYHISRRQLALQIGVDHVTLSRIENNDVRAISTEILGKIYVWQISKVK